MRKILNIAHRGFTRDFPDNTIEAFKAALQLGVDGIEFDVQETADGEFVVFHDDEIDAVKIEHMSLEQVRLHLVDGKYKVPTFVEPLALCSGDILLLIELKTVKAIDRFLEILRSHAALDSVVLASFSREIISSLSRLAPDIMHALITDFAIDDPSKISSLSQSRFIGVHCSYLTENLVSAAHNRNLIVFVWGCADAGSVRKALSFDIDGIISDCPDEVKQVLNNKKC